MDEQRTRPAAEAAGSERMAGVPLALGMQCPGSRDGALACIHRILLCMLASIKVSGQARSERLNV